MAESVKSLTLFLNFSINTSNDTKGAEVSFIRHKKSEQTLPPTNPILDEAVDVLEDGGDATKGPKTPK